MAQEQAKKEITIDEIKHLANLARIEVTDEECQKLKGEFEDILGYVQVVDDIASDAHKEKKVGELRNVLREDENSHEGGVFTDKLLANAPNREDQYVRVKKILADQ